MIAIPKSVLKRGALVAAANWPVIFIQALTDSLFKLLIAVPVLGGIVLVTLVVGADPGVLLSLEWRDLVPTLVAALQSRPLVLGAFLASVGVVVLGGSLLVFLVKGGTVTVLVAGERAAGPIERPPLRFDAIAQAACFSVERFADGARRLFPRYTRLGLLLIATYIVSGTVYVTAVVLGAAGDGWLAMAVVTLLFAIWVALVNLFYLITQIVIAAEGCGVAPAARLAAGFLRHDLWHVFVVFAVVLATLIVATGASVLATALLGMIAFVPFFGLTVLPLQLIAWLLRGLVFEYIALASIGAYVRLYRTHAAVLAGRAAGAYGVGSTEYGPALDGRS